MRLKNTGLNNFELQQLKIPVLLIQQSFFETLKDKSNLDGTMDEKDKTVF